MKCKIIFDEESRIEAGERDFEASIRVAGIDLPQTFLDRKFDKRLEIADDVFSFRRNDLLFGFASVEISEGIEFAARRIYRAFLDSLGGRNLYRFWNFIPRVTDKINGEIAYESFNAGRREAFRQFFGDGFEKKFPAATGIGITGERLVVMCVAGADKTRNLENPRQTSATLYPKAYCGKPPSFARATEVEDKYYFISGTASIRGPESKHEGDLGKQLELTIRNLHEMIAQSDLCERLPTSAIVYCKRAEDIDFVRTRFREDFPDIDNTIYLRAEICRKELLVEIEITYGDLFRLISL